MQMDCHHIQTNWCPHLCHTHNFYARYPSWHKLPNLSLLRTGTKYASLLIPSGLVILRFSNATIISDQSNYFISGWLDTDCWWWMKHHLSMGFSCCKLFIMLLFLITHCEIVLVCYTFVCFSASVVFLFAKIKLYHVLICCNKKLWLTIKCVEHADNDNWNILKKVAYSSYLNCLYIKWECISWPKWTGWSVQTHWQSKFGDCKMEKYYWLSCI